MRCRRYALTITPATSDESLVRAAQDGDIAALDTLLRRHFDRIYAVCRRIAGNDADAADAAQEALITISRRIDRFDGRSQFSTWAYRVATNACLDELRRRKRRPDPGLPEYETEVPERDRVPDLAEEHVVRSELDEALAALPADYRAPVVLRDVVGMDYADIATTLDIPPGTVRSRIARGRAALRKQLSGNQNRPEERQTKRP